MNAPPAVNPTPNGNRRLAVSPTEAARMAGIGRTTLYKALGSGALSSLKIGSRRLITVDALKAWLAAAERVGRGDTRDAM